MIIIHHTHGKRGKRVGIRGIGGMIGRDYFTTLQRGGGMAVGLGVYFGVEQVGLRLGDVGFHVVVVVQITSRVPRVAVVVVVVE